MRQGNPKPGRSWRPRRNFAAPPEPLEARRLLSASFTETAIPNVTLQPAATSATVGGYSPGQIRDAYGFNEVSGNGAGQTIAIVDAYADSKITSDLATFDTKFGLAAPPKFSVVSQTGGSIASVPVDSGWAGEISLDVEWAHAIAPGANILLVETNSSDLNNLLAGVNYARKAAGVSVVSMSWGGGEFYGETNYDSSFTTPTGHTGVTFVAASGDDGSYYGVEWPASSPNVVSVGGTSLTTSSLAGTYSTESPWSGSTGGYSSYESEPAYQEVVQSSGVRTVPDIAYVANPNTGLAVYDSVSYGGSSGWQVTGGTSCGAPQWGALVAISDQTRAAAKLGTLDGPSQTLPAMYKPYSNAVTYTADYHDVTGISRSWFGGVRITDEGYDLQTGLGTPKAPSIIPALSQSGGSTTTSAASSSSVHSSGGSAQVALAPADVHADPSPAQTDVAVGVETTTPVSSESPAPIPLPTVFNDTLVHHDVAALTGNAIGIHLNEQAAPRPVTALASATRTQWLGNVDGALVSWMTAGGPTSGLVNWVASTDQTKAALPSADGVIAAAATTPGARLLSAAVVAPMASLPANIIYRFANFDPAGTFADAMADFARESASISPMAAVAGHPSHRAWIITGVVLGIDAMLVANWYAARAGDKRKDHATKNLPAPDLQSPQAGPLPTGL